MLSALSNCLRHRCANGALDRPPHWLRNGTRGLISLLSKYDNLLYVQIWEKQLKVTETRSGRVLEEESLVAVRTDKKGRKVIHSIGASAKMAAGPDISLLNPFSHPRVLLSDFAAGEKLLGHLFREMFEQKLLVPSPVVVVHPMEKTKGGLTDIERRAFRELAAGAGAREVFVHEGAELSIHDLREGGFEEEKEVESLSWRKGSVWSSFFTFVLLVLGLLFSIFLGTWKGD